MFIFSLGCFLFVPRVSNRFRSVWVHLVDLSLVPKIPRLSRHTIHAAAHRPRRSSLRILGNLVPLMMLLSSWLDFPWFGTIAKCKCLLKSSLRQTNLVCQSCKFWFKVSVATFSTIGANIITMHNFIYLRIHFPDYAISLALRNWFQMRFLVM